MTINKRVWMIGGPVLCVILAGVVFGVIFFGGGESSAENTLVSIETEIQELKNEIDALYEDEHKNYPVPTATKERVAALQVRLAEVDNKAQKTDVYHEKKSYIEYMYSDLEILHTMAVVTDGFARIFAEEIPQKSEANEVLLAETKAAVLELKESKEGFYRTYYDKVEIAEITFFVEERIEELYIKGTDEIDTELDFEYLFEEITACLALLENREDTIREYFLVKLEDVQKEVKVARKAKKALEKLYDENGELKEDITKEELAAAKKLLKKLVSANLKSRLQKQLDEADIQFAARSGEDEADELALASESLLLTQLPIGRGNGGTLSNTGSSNTGAIGGGNTGTGSTGNESGGGAGSGNTGTGNTGNGSSSTGGSGNGSGSTGGSGNGSGSTGGSGNGSGGTGGSGNGGAGKPGTGGGGNTGSGNTGSGNGDGDGGGTTPPETPGGGNGGDEDGNGGGTTPPETPGGGDGGDEGGSGGSGDGDGGGNSGGGDEGGSGSSGDGDNGSGGDGGSEGGTDTE